MKYFWDCVNKSLIFPPRGYDCVEQVFTAKPAKKVLIKSWNVNEKNSPVWLLKESASKLKDIGVTHTSRLF